MIVAYAIYIYVQVKSEKWNGMFVDLLPGNPVDSGTIIKAQIEQPPEPMVFKVLCVRQHALINPRRACAARVTVVGRCVCLSVCLFVCLFVCSSVDDYSRTTGYEAAYERYQQLQCYKGMKNNVAILLKRLRSRDMA